MDYRKRCLQAKGTDCEVCGTGEGIVVHHLDGDRANNDLENLIPVCRRCHYRIHSGAEGLEKWTNQLLPRAEREDPPAERFSLRLNGERKRLLDEAADVVASAPNDDPPRSDVIDAALTHLVESEQNIDEARDEYDPETIQDIANTSVLSLHYRTSIDSRWR